MRTLEEMRNEINALDTELKSLLTKRFSLSAEIASLKKESGGAVFIPEREEEVLSGLTAGLSIEPASKISSLFRSIMRLSRELQYSLLLNTSAIYTPSYIKEDIKKQNEGTPGTVCYQGLPGAYSHAASIKMHPGAGLVNVPQFEDIFIKVSENGAQYGVLPLENSIAGIVSEVYDLLIKYRLFASGSYMLPINHALQAVPGAVLSGIKRVLSHPQSLSQCSAYIRRMGFEAISVSNNAVAADMVAELKEMDTAAIASEDTASVYGLKILERNIANEKNNYTRFISISASLNINPDDNKIIIVFSLPHKSGALSSVLSVFADYKISLSHIQSRPRPDAPWEYSFYADFDGNLNDRDTQAVLIQLEKELPMVRVLGTYQKSGGV